MTARRRHYPLQFVTIEGLRKDVETAVIEHGSPQVVICRPRGYYECRRGRQLPQIVKQCLPVGTLGNHNVSLLPMGALKRFAAVGHFV
jgi:hypothetical protein